MEKRAKFGQNAQNLLASDVDPMCPSTKNLYQLLACTEASEPEMILLSERVARLARLREAISVEFLSGNYAVPK